MPECSSNSVVVDEQGGQFECPRQSQAGVFTKHAHPADCRQYFLCIGGTPREYGCPLGTVFNVGSGSGVDGKCSDPEEVPECADYYGDLDFKSADLTRNGFDTGRRSGERVRSGGDRFRNTQNSITGSRPVVTKQSSVSSSSSSSSFRHLCVNSCSIVFQAMEPSQKLQLHHDLHKPPRIFNSSVSW